MSDSAQILTLPSSSKPKRKLMDKERLYCSRCDTELFILLATGILCCSNCHRTIDNVHLSVGERK